MEYNPHDHLNQLPHIFFNKKIKSIILGGSSHER